MQAALASILELNLDAVPDFSQYRSWFWDKFAEFLSEQGLQHLSLEIKDDWTPQGWHLTVGTSPRGDFNHVVVGKAGKMIHDPHPSGVGLENAGTYIVFLADMDTVGLPS